MFRNKLERKFSNQEDIIGLILSASSAKSKRYENFTDNKVETYLHEGK